MVLWLATRMLAAPFVASFVEVILILAWVGLVGKRRIGGL